MRLNKFLASYTHLSRRKADEAILEDRILLNGTVATIGQVVSEDDVVSLDGKIVKTETSKVTVLLNKPEGYVCSRKGQGSPTIYDLLPEKFQPLNIAGRLDKDSSGLVILTNDGDLLFKLTHPSQNKQKIYLVTLDKPLSSAEFKQLKKGVDIGDDRPSSFEVTKLDQALTYQVRLSEGRNRQIRRSFEAIGYDVIELHRIQIAGFKLGAVKSKSFTLIKPE